MKTDDLIAMLSRGVDPVDTDVLRRRYTVALGWGAFGATLLMAILLGVRPDLVEAVWLPMFWAKLAFPAALLAGALLVTIRLSRPGVRIALLSAPLFGAVLWAMKGLAPANLALAGAAAGLFSGAGGALIYALYCPEMAASFIASWYLLGILIPAALGALLGPRLLRW